MRGVGYTLYRPLSAAAMLAGAAILAGTVSTATAKDVGGREDIAFAMPRVAPFMGGSAGGADLPQPLAPSDAVLLRRGLDLQANRAFLDADGVLDGVADDLLNGYVLAQRYLMLGSAAPADSVAEWLARYADQPDAPALHAMLMARMAPGAEAPPVQTAAPPGAEAEPGESAPPDIQLVRNPLLDRTVRERAHAGQAESALRLLDKTRGLDAVYGNQLRAEVAQALFTHGRDIAALNVAQDAFRRSRGRVALAAYVAGLAAWRTDRPELAQALFEQASLAEIATPSVRAGAAFWAARAHLHGHDAVGSAAWMRKAAEAGHTFYGLLARRAIGLGQTAGRATLGAADNDALMALPGGKRAFALLQIGEPRGAEAELRLLWAATTPRTASAGAIVRVAQAAGLADLAAELAGIIETADHRLRDDARDPLPDLRPAGGFRMDPALVYALTRLESNFDPSAVSGAGARGLMQVMPVTAGFLAGDGASVASYYRRLHDPATNLSVGQSYVLYLAGMQGVAGDLIRLLGSYNAGPTSFARMMSGQPLPNDPLLFIESIPNDETRAFVPRALAYSWIYAARLRLPAPSLDELAAGAWPAFHTIAPRREAMARLH